MVYNEFTKQTKKGAKNMSEREKEIIETIAEALPHMPDFEKGYMLGQAEAMAAKKKKQKQEAVEKAG